MAAVVRIPVQDVPSIGRAEATRLARVEYARFLALLCALGPDDWDRPTDCTRWTVKDVVAHIVGETEAFASLPELVHQWRHAARVRREIGAHHLIDGVNEVEVRDRRALSPSQLIGRMGGRGGAALRLRGRLPRPGRAGPGAVPAGGPRSVGDLVGLLLTPHVWMR